MYLRVTTSVRAASERAHFASSISAPRVRDYSRGHVSIGKSAGRRFDSGRRLHLFEYLGRILDCRQTAARQRVSKWSDFEGGAAGCGRSAVHVAPLPDLDDQHVIAARREWRFTHNNADRCRFSVRTRVARMTTWDPMSAACQRKAQDRGAPSAILEFAQRASERVVRKGSTSATARTRCSRLHAPGRRFRGSRGRRVVLVRATSPTRHEPQ